MNARRLTPSMSSLVAFEASARAESFTKAAEQLSLTQSAVSRQVQVLEELLGVPLFQRVGRHVALTEVGRMYLRELSGPLEQIRSATLQAIAFRSGGGTLTLAVLPTFGSKWLLPRLPDFYGHHPEVLVRIHARTYLDLETSGMDAAIAVGDGKWPGCVSVRLVEECLVPIISPLLAEMSGPITIDDLLRNPLLHVVTRPNAWQNWLAAKGVHRKALPPGMQFELTSHLIQAVSAGVGCGLVPQVLVEDELRAGTLVSPNGYAPFYTGQGYYLVVSSDRAHYPPFVQFRDWLLTQGPTS